MAYQVKYTEGDKHKKSKLVTGKDNEKQAKRLVNTRKRDAVSTGIVKGESEKGIAARRTNRLHSRRKRPNDNTIDTATRVNLGTTFGENSTNTPSAAVSGAAGLGNAFNDMQNSFSNFMQESATSADITNDDDDRDNTSDDDNRYNRFPNQTDYLDSLYNNNLSPEQKRRWRRKMLQQQQQQQAAKAGAKAGAQAGSSAAASKTAAKSSSSTAAKSSSTKAASTGASTAGKAGAKAGAQAAKAGATAAKTGASAAAGAATGGVAIAAQVAAEAANKAKEKAAKDLRETAFGAEEDEEESPNASLGCGCGLTGCGCLVVLMPVFLAILVVLLILAGFSLGLKKPSVGGLTGKEAEIAQALLNLGFDRMHTAAILGNMVAESSALDSHAFQPQQRRDMLYGVERINWQGFGLIQWTESRKDRLCGLADSKGKQHCDQDTQMEFLKQEVESGTQWLPGRAGDYKTTYTDSNGVGHSYTGRVLSYPQWNGDQTSPEQLAIEWAASYERCNSGVDGHLENRCKQARRIYDAMGSGDNDVVSRAKAECGKPYVWGAVGPDGYDCSGLVSYALTGKHIRLGTTTTFMTWEQTSDPQPGDVVTNEYHCAIYIGNGKVIHAPNFNDVVKESTVEQAFWGASYIYVKYKPN